MPGARSAASLFVLALIATLALGCKPEAKKTYLIALANINPNSWAFVEGFEKGMAEEGFVEGVNVRYLRLRGGEGFERELAEAAASKPDLVFAVTTPATKLAAKLTKPTGTPVVFIAFDAVSSGLVRDLSKPADNLTGLQLRGCTPKALEWFLAVAPGTKELFVPITYDTEAARASLDDLKGAALKLGVRLKVAELSSNEQLLAALSALPPRTDAIFLLNSILISSNTKLLVEEGFKRKVPVGAAVGSAENGSLTVFTVKHSQVGSRAGALAASILKGTRVADLPVETADCYLGVNLKTASALGLQVPDEVLSQADLLVR